MSQKGSDIISKAELQAATGPYSLDAALARDRVSNNCFVLDVTRNDRDASVKSLQRVVAEVDNYLINVHDRAAPVTKLYVVGSWHLASEVEGLTQCDNRLIRADGEPQYCTPQEQEWQEANRRIAKLLAQMPGLEELTWISGLPFMESVWAGLTTSLTTLVLDLGRPVRLHIDGDVLHQSRISANEMKPLKNHVQLKELRLFRMYDSLQPLIWETVYRNISEGGMRVLDLQMVSPPLIRSKRWHTAGDIVGLTVINDESVEKEYKGLDGKGVLHYSVGTGEYVDDFCIRRARIAAGIEEARPLPVWCLKLDGFVVDHLPFQHELSQIVLLTCGENCVDAGLRAPRIFSATRNFWSSFVNNAVTHCAIQWPKWTGIFDNRGDQRDTHGDIVSQEAGISTPIDGCLHSSTPMSTDRSLQMKELDTALDGVSADEVSVTIRAGFLTSQAYAAYSPALNASMRGSEAPSLRLVTQGSPMILARDVSLMSSPESPADVSLRLMDSNTNPTDLGSPISIYSSFEHVDVPAAEDASVAAAHGSDDAAEAIGTASKINSFTYKVRRSLGRWTGSA